MKDEKKTKQQLIDELKGLRQQVDEGRSSEAVAAPEDKLVGEVPFFKAIAESSVTGIYIYDAEKGNNIYLNPQYTTLTGYSLDDLNAMTPEEFFASLLNSKILVASTPSCEST